jgi:PAS domain S-box-containing protein
VTPLPSPSPKARLFEIAALAAVYFGAAQLGLSLAFSHPNASPVWPPTGIALAAVLLWGYPVWPGIMLGAFFANAWTAVPLWTAGSIAVGNTLAALAGVFLIRRFIGFRSPLEQARNFFKFAVLGAGLSCTVSATVGVTSLCLGGSAPWTAYAWTWWTWWLGDSIGVLIVCSLVLAWHDRPSGVWDRRRLAEGALLTVLLLSVTQIVFGGWSPLGVSHYPLEFALLPFFVWAGFRFGQRGATTLIFLATGVGVWGTVHGFGPFVRDTLNESLLLLQGYMGVGVTTILAITAVLTERKTAETLLDDERVLLEKIATRGPLSKALDALCLSTEKHSNGMLCSILLLDADGVHLRHGAAPSLPATYCQTIDGLAIGPAVGSCGTAAYLGRQVLVSDIATDPLWANYRELAFRHQLRACWSSPICSTDGVILGTFALYYREPRSPSLGELHLIGRATDLAAIAIERERAEAALCRSEEQLRLFVEHSPAAVAMLDRHMRYLMASRRWHTDYKLGEQDLTGRSYYEVFPEIREMPHWMEIHRRCLRGAVERCDEDPFPRADGRMDWVRWEIHPWFERTGEIGGIIMYTEVITERKRLAEQLRQSQKMETVGRLAGGIAHTFNNILTAILIQCDLLKRGLPAKDTRISEIEAIGKAGEQAAALTRQLLAFSQRQVLQPRALNLNAVVRQVEDMIRQLVGEGRMLVTALAPELGHVKADPEQIQHVILNLAVNAVDAMPRGGTLTIVTANVDLATPSVRPWETIPQGSYVNLVVRDTGVGMDLETCAHLFEPFFTTKEVGQGAGLGLAMAHGIVKQTGGYVDVDSEPGRGTMFMIYLPRIEDAPQARPECGAQTTSPRGSETILVVDDEPMVRRLIRRILETSSYTVLEAQQGDEAIRLLEQHPAPIHLLLTDMVMPGINGQELANRGLALHPSLKVLFMTGYLGEAVSRHEKEAVVPAILLKPFKPDDLTRKVREILG